MTIMAQPRFTPEQYLARERAAATKSELVNGHIYAMAGASRRHNLIVFNFVRALGNRLADRPCEVYVNDMRVKVQATEMYTYPDIAALCDAPVLEDDHVDTLLNPAVIIEVLSDSTEAYDRGDKFSHYRKLESLREYILVAQNTVRIERYVRHGKHWMLTEVVGDDAVLPIDALDCEIPLAEIYHRIDTTPDDIQPDLRARSVR